MHYDLWWNPAVENQATDRAFRIGQCRVPSVFEAEQLSQSLRNGIATQQRYRASELYSKNKHFMAE